MKKTEQRKKLCFAASSGGHYEQLMMLQPLMKKYASFIVTERTEYQINHAEIPTYYLAQVNRREPLCLVKLVTNTFRSAHILWKEKPDAVICTGVLATIPLCLLAKLMRRKLIYIESFAKVTSATMTGKLLYRFADQFYVQWPQMREVYPKAIYLGGIY